MADFFNACFGAFFGAACAFLFAYIERLKTQEKKEHDSLIEVQYSLGFMLNSVEHIWRQHLRAEESNPNRHGALPSLNFPDHQLTIDHKGIMFIAGQGAAPLVQDLFMAEKAFLNALDAMRQRNRAHEELEFHPTTKLLAFDASTGKADINPHPFLLNRLKLTTDSVYRTVPRASELLKKALTDVIHFTRSKYPGMGVLVLEDDESTITSP